MLVVVKRLTKFEESADILRELKFYRWTALDMVDEGR